MGLNEQLAIDRQHAGNFRTHLTPQASLVLEQVQPHPAVGGGHRGVQRHAQGVHGQLQTLGRQGHAVDARQSGITLCLKTIPGSSGILAHHQATATTGQGDRCRALTHLSCHALHAHQQLCHRLTRNLGEVGAQGQASFQNAQAVHTQTALLDLHSLDGAFVCKMNVQCLS